MATEKISGRGRTLLSIIEEKLAFPVSRWFWHIFIGLAILVFISSFVVLLYSITPVFKQKVSRQPYPPMVEVNSSDMKICKDNRATSQGATESQKSGSIYAAFTELEELIPPAKYEWREIGYYSTNYYYGETWVPTDLGITAPLRECLDKVAANDTLSQKKIIHSLALIIKGFQEKGRKKCVQYVLKWINTVPIQCDSILSVTDKVAAYLNTADNTQLFCKISDFGRTNPNDGVPFIQIFNVIMSAQQPEHFNKLFEVTTEAFKNNFDENIEVMTDATNKFVKLPSSERVDPVLSLPCFYNIYISRYNERMVLVRDVDSLFSASENAAQTAFETKKISKQSKRDKALMVLCGSLSIVAFFSLMLVLLSIQRSMKRLVEMAEGGK